MSEIIRATLPEARRRYEEQNPGKGLNFDIATLSASLADPDNRKNLFFTTIEWPIDEDPYAACDVRVNFPEERLKSGQGFIGLNFRYETPSDNGTYFKTEVKVIHGIGQVGLVEPLSVSMTEYLTDGADPITEPIWTPTDFEAAAAALSKFNIV